MLQVNFVIELKDEATQTEKWSLLKLIETANFAKSGTVKFISKEEAVKQLQSEMEKDMDMLSMTNPLFDVITFNVSSNFATVENLNQIQQHLLQQTAVSEVFYQQNEIGQLLDILNQVGIAVLIISFFLMFLAYNLIHNTIKLSLYANRIIIKNMQLVGAKWSFISRPYLLRSLLNGFIGGVLAVLILSVILFFVRNEIIYFQNFQYIHSFALLFGGLILLGILTSFISTYFVLRKHLKSTQLDFY